MDYAKEAYGNLGDGPDAVDDYPDMPETPAGFVITKEWVMAGKAIFTVSNGKGEHYTYQVKRKENDQKGRPPVWFVSLLTGPDNSSDYSYLGCLRPATGNVDLTRASRMNDTSVPVRVIRWAMRILWSGAVMPDGYSLNGCGRCGRCGRQLTRPEGIDPAGYRFGYGPECFSKIGG
jgi:hypothetical protein